MSPKSLLVQHVLFSLAGLVLAVTCPLFCFDDRRRRAIYTAVLLPCALWSFYLYLELGPQFRAVQPAQIMNAHDFFHYYVGSKYHRELGYFDLYDCSLYVDQTTGQHSIPPDGRVRNLRTYGQEPVERVMERGRSCEGRFSEPRWREFQYDVRYLSGLMSPSRWELVLQDKGYNATPIWTAFAGAWTNAISLRNTAGLYALLSLDYIYVVASILGVAWAFGFRESLLVTMFWSLNFVASLGFDRGSVSRLDWLACLVLAVCLLRRGRHTGAGVLAAVATLFRVFPVLFFTGLAARCAWILVRERRIPAGHLRFGLAFAATVALGFGATTITERARSAWKDFQVKITSHDEQIAGYRVGLKYALIDPSDRTHGKRQLEDREGLRFAAIALAVAAVAVGAQRLRDHETPGLSFICVVFLTAPTFYYYQMLVIPFLLFLPARARPALVLGMAGLFGWSVMGYVMQQNWQLGPTLSHHLSISLILLAAFVFLLVMAAFPGREQGDPDGGPPTTLAPAP